jgi:hypothetical protein
VRARERTLWPVVGLFLLSRLAIWVLAVAVLLVGPEHLDPEAASWGTVVVDLPGSVADVWNRWDAGWYARIAEGGYRWPSATPAFYPLLPLLMAPVGRLLGGQYPLAGVLVSLTAGSAAVAGLYRLGRGLLDEPAAWRAVVYLCVFPTSIFLGAPYAESLLLALAIATFLLAERGRLGWAACTVGLALLTRPQGAALLAALAVLLWQRRGARGLPLLAIPVGIFALYPLTLWVWIGRPLQFLDAQGLWERSLSPLGPLGGVAQAVQEGDWLELAFVVAFLPLAVAAWRMLGTAYGVYAVSALVIPMSVPSARLGGLYSFPRFAIIAFPCFLVLGALGRRLPVHVAVVSVSIAWLGINVTRWALWEWVA